MIISVDFDGVIHGYESGWTGYEPTDPPVPGAGAALKKLIEDGHEVVIFSTRAFGADNIGVEYIKEYMDKHKIPYSRIALEKPKAAVSIDDRAYRFNGSWKDALEFVRGDTRPWNKR